MGGVIALFGQFMSGVCSCCYWIWRTFINTRFGKSITNKSSEDRTLDFEMGKDWSDFDTKCDSTWEDDEEEEDKESKEVSMKWSYSAGRNEYAAKDMQNFRLMLRDVNKKTKETTEKSNRKFPNLQFYRNQKPSEPDGVFIEEYHKTWFGDYRKLEYTHSFIQWLFPIQEKGMNWESYVLKHEEIKLFREDEEVKKRLVKSYKLMLDFYGIKLLDEKTGKVCRIKDKWEDRFENLNSHTHNNLRITRILKCLGILGFQHYQPPLVKFFLHHTLVKGELPRVKQSALDYFLFSVVDKDERKKLIKFAFQNFQPKGEFVWCPKRIQRKFQKEINQQIKEDNLSDLSEPESDAEENPPDNEGASVFIPVGAAQGDPRKKVVGEGNTTNNQTDKPSQDDAVSIQNNQKDSDADQDQQNLRMEDGQNIGSSNIGDGAGDGDGAGAAAAVSEIQDGTGTNPHSEGRMSGMTSTDEAENKQASGREEKEKDEKEEKNRTTKKDSIIAEWAPVMPNCTDLSTQNDVGNQVIVSSTEDDGANAEALQNGPDPPNIEMANVEDSAPDSENQHKSSDTEKTKYQVANALGPDILSSNDFNKMNANQSVNKSPATADTGRKNTNEDDADELMEFSETEGDADNKMVGATDGMSDNQESEQRQDEEVEDDNLMDVCKTGNDTDPSTQNDVLHPSSAEEENNNSGINKGVLVTSNEDDEANAKGASVQQDGPGPPHQSDTKMA